MTHPHPPKPFSVSYQCGASFLQFYLSLLCLFKVTGTGPVNISHLPAGTLLSFVIKEYWKDIAVWVVCLPGSGVLFPSGSCLMHLLGGCSPFSKSQWYPRWWLPIKFLWHPSEWILSKSCQNSSRQFPAGKSWFVAPQWISLSSSGQSNIFPARFEAQSRWGWALFQVCSFLGYSAWVLEVVAAPFICYSCVLWNSLHFLVVNPCYYWITPYIKFSLLRLLLWFLAPQWTLTNSHPNQIKSNQANNKELNP